jgi:1-acyl-sn-glycerol-3-phosphate acyltransferase
VVNFPEGSTTRGDSLLPFRRGIFGIARLAGAPVVPVALRAEHHDFPWVGSEAFLPHYARMASRDDNVLHVSIGEPMAPSHFDSAEALAAAAEERVSALLGGESENPWRSISQRPSAKDRAPTFGRAPASV